MKPCELSKPQVQINGDRILSVPLPKDMPEVTYQVVIVMNPQPDPDDTPDEIVIEGIRQGLKETISGQTIPPRANVGRD